MRSFATSTKDPKRFTSTLNWTHLKPFHEARALFAGNHLAERQIIVHFRPCSIFSSSSPRPALLSPWI